jgi:hypothetical protein
MSYDLRSPDFRRDIFTYYNGEKEEKIPYELKIWKYKIDEGVALVGSWKCISTSNNVD